MNYGTPYKGSKSRIAPWLIEHLPENEVFVDLFAGGCAATHAAMLSNKWQRFIANDISDAPQLFADALSGKYADETRWISREDFYRLKDSDPYVRRCWSFSNNGENYLYAKEVEPWKKALHYARVLHDPSLLREMGIESDGSRADIKAHREEYKEKYIRWWLSRQEYTVEELDTMMESTKQDITKDEEELRNYLLDALHKSGLTQSEVQKRLGTQMAKHYFGRSQWEFPTQEMYEKMQEFMTLPTDYNELVGLYRLRQRLQSLQGLERLQSLQGLESLQRLQGLESLQRLQRLQDLERLQSDYKDVAIPRNATVYADPPYRGTDCSGYAAFDFDSFDNWLRNVPFMVIVSEYSMPDDFVVVAECQQVLKQTAFQKSEKKEKLFVHKRWAKEYQRQMYPILREA